MTTHFTGRALSSTKQPLSEVESCNKNLDNPDCVAVSCRVFMKSPKSTVYDMMFWKMDFASVTP